MARVIVKGRIAVRRPVTVGVLERVARAAEAEERERQSPRHWFAKSPAWSIAIALHLLVAIALMNVVRYTMSRRDDGMFRISFRQEPPPRPADLEEKKAPSAGGDGSGDQDNGTGGVHGEDSAPAGMPDKTDPTPTGSGEEGLPLAIGIPITTNKGVAKLGKGTGTSGKNGPGGLYDGRGGAGRGQALKRFGGDGVTEDAVKKGLEWLARHQSPNGSWSPLNFGKQCPKRNRCGGASAETKYTTACTGLTILAFLGAGHTHNDKGPWADTVSRGLNWLLEQQDRYGCMDPTGQSNFYTHGIATLALTEAYSMTQEPRFRAPAQKAVRFTCDGTSSTGGWDYTPFASSRSDASITSWQVMSLRSARAAGLAVSKTTWEGVETFMQRALRPDGVAYSVYGYGGGCQTDGCNTMTAAGLATRFYLGMVDEKVEERLVRILLETPPRFDRVEGTCGKWSSDSRCAHQHWSLYYTYNATLAVFHYGGEAWEKWNEQLRAVTLPAQKTKGCEAGSWDPLPWDCQKVGRIYATALNVLNLEIYYRYLPCYQSGSTASLPPLLDDAAWEKGRGDQKSARDVAALPPKELPARERIDPGSVKQALAELKSEDMMKRRAAAQVIVMSGNREAVGAMIEAARVEKTSLKPVLIEMLQAYELDAALADYLVGELASESKEVKAAATKSLQFITGLDLKTREEWVRWKEELGKEE